MSVLVSEALLCRDEESEEYIQSEIPESVKQIKWSEMVLKCDVTDNSETQNINVTVNATLRYKQRDHDYSEMGKCNGYTN